MTIDLTHPADADVLWVVADRLRFCGGLPGHAPQVIEVEVPPGSGTPPHRHASAEMFHVVEGTLTITHFPDGAPPVIREAGPGAVVKIAGWAGHNYANHSDRPVKMLVLIEPEMVSFFREIGTSEPAEPDFAKIGAAMGRHGIEMLSVAA